MTGDGRRAILLDRDGTLLSTDEHLGDPGLVALVPGAADALRALGARGWLRVVVTNQSGVARRFFTEERYREVEAAFLAAIRAGGGDLEAIYVCHHLPEAADIRWAKDCDCRKPRPGMILRAAAEHARRDAREPLAPGRVERRAGAERDHDADDGERVARLHEHRAVAGRHATARRSPALPLGAPGEAALHALAHDASSLSASAPSSSSSPLVPSGITWITVRAELTR